MDALRNLAALGLLLTLTVRAAQAQETETLPLFTPVTGTITSGSSDQWVFAGADGAMLSFDLEAKSGDLDPILTITSSAGALVMSNDDYEYPESQAARLEGITLPRTDTYTVTVSGFGATQGDYELTMQAGFARLSYQDSFEDETRWKADSDTLQLVFGNHRMALILSDAQQRAAAIYTGNAPWDDQYIHIDVPELTARGTWRVGLMARVQDDQAYYLFSLNDQGQWRFSLQTPDGERVLRDWSSHPAIVAGQTTFSLGLLANGTGFDFFYNGQLIGRLSDDSLIEPGQVGLMIETGSALDSELTAQFQNLTITTPGDPIVPQQLLTGNAPVMTQELQRRRLIPADGEMKLIVPESFVTFNRPGVNILPLGGSETYRTFALGATLTWEIATPSLPAGCGLILRAAGQDDYLLAYLDQTGGYGLSQRRGSTFEPGIFDQGPEPGSGPHRLLVIANEDHLLYYVDGQLAGMLDSPAASGTIGNAAVNFESTTTSCQFTDTWVWSWG
ncbi:MAG: hypothetical protein K8J31_30775 [Anaerolineae bacterium]|nr:hypothetical protein [Anaerolineae bacterium]